VSIAEVLTNALRSQMIDLVAALRNEPAAGPATDEHIVDELLGLPGYVALRTEADDARNEYELLRDLIIERLNPRDDDVSEVSIMIEAVESITRFVESLPCTCPPNAGPPDWDALACPRCQVLGRARDARIDR
jgi:hypothetical protein